METLIKRKMDWEGLKVKSLKPLKNGWASLPEGKIFTVGSWSRGLSMRSNPCECCGIRLSISRVSSNDVELLDIDFNRELIEWNSKRKLVKTRFGTDIVLPTENKPIYQDESKTINSNT